MTLGSFFDGIGGWLLAAKHAGVEPMWASEIDDFPAAVTAHHFPQVKQLGDITKINVNDIEPVDIICAGSPCQDLSVAGKREGLSGERSGLFRTAIKLVHGLRARTGKPRYFVWENVPGAFSSNKGLDFKAVLEEITESEIPMPESGKWAEAGMVEWDGGSLAWRVLDAQYWGVPQRRKRIFLVADFTGHSAGEILFERKGLSGDSAKSEGEGQEATEGIGKSIDGTIEVMPFDTTQITSPQNGSHPMYGKPCHNLNANAHIPAIVIKAYDMTHADEVIRAVHGNKTQTLNARMGTGGNNTPILHVLNGQESTRIQSIDGKAATLYGGAGQGTHNGAIFDTRQVAYSFDSKASNSMKSANPHSGCRQVEIAKCLDTTVPNPSKNQGGIAIVCKPKEVEYAITAKHYKNRNAALRDRERINVMREKTGTLTANNAGGNQRMPDKNHFNAVISKKSVRRLTTTECERLQGLPDGYTDIEFNGKPAPDSRRYKALGNGMAQPCADFVIRRIAEVVTNGA